MKTTEKLIKNYDKAILNYIKAFEEKYEVECEQVAGSSQIAIANFTDIKFAIDNDLPFNVLAAYNDYFLEFNEIAPINLESFSKRRADFLYENGFGFSEEKFTNELLKIRLKSLKTK